MALTICTAASVLIGGVVGVEGSNRGWGIARTMATAMVISMVPPIALRLLVVN